MTNQLSLFAEENEGKEKVERQVYEFLIVINLPDDINDYVKHLKDEFYEEFGYFPSRGSKSHITISKFPFVEKQPDAIFSFLLRSFQKISPFEININGFDRFPNGRVIYLSVEDSSELNKLKAPFNKIRGGFKPKNYFHVLGKNPHITIARGVRPDIFAKAEKDYLSRAYASSFLVDKMNVLRRELKEDGKHDKYKHVCYLTLGEEQ